MFCWKNVYSFLFTLLLPCHTFFSHKKTFKKWVISNDDPNFFFGERMTVRESLKKGKEEIFCLQGWLKKDPENWHRELPQYRSLSPFIYLISYTNFCCRSKWLPPPPKWSSFCFSRDTEKASTNRPKRPTHRRDEQHKPCHRHRQQTKTK